MDPNDPLGTERAYQVLINGLRKDPIAGSVMQGAKDAWGALPGLAREFGEDPGGTVLGVGTEMARAHFGLPGRGPGVQDQTAADLEFLRQNPEVGAAHGQMGMPIRDPRLISAFTPKMRELLNDPPTSLEGFTPMSEFRNRYRSQYQGEAAGTRNSRFDPSTETLAPGTWVIDDLKGIHGREIGYSTRIDPGPVQISEFLPERADDVARYAEWNRAGMEPPPVSALETDKGALKIGDGHRRRLAAIESGSQLPAVVWPTGPHPQGLSEFGKTDPMRVGLTYEMIEALRNPK